MEPIDEKLAGILTRMADEIEVLPDGTAGIGSPEFEFTDPNTGADCAIYDQDLSLFVVIATMSPSPQHLMTGLSN